jgi:hypothetical protein
MNMEITLKLKSLKDAKTLLEKLGLASEEAHDLGDEEDEELFIELCDQLRQQMPPKLQ